MKAQLLVLSLVVSALVSISSLAPHKAHADATLALLPCSWPLYTTLNMMNGNEMPIYTLIDEAYVGQGYHLTELSQITGESIETLSDKIILITKDKSSTSDQIGAVVEWLNTQFKSQLQ